MPVVSTINGSSFFCGADANKKQPQSSCVSQCQRIQITMQLERERDLAMPGDSPSRQQ